jgi:RNA polymerase sigma factor (sigma-70 family)
MERTEVFDQERGRLVSIASRLLNDRHEAEDIVQQTWIRLHRSTTEIVNLPAWLVTVTTRLCVDRLRARVPVPAELNEDPEIDGVLAGSTGPSSDPSAYVERTEAVGQALHVIVNRLSPNERVALVLHESFGFDFDTIGEFLDRTPTAARKLASRARTKVAGAEQGGPVTDRHVVDAFMEAAKGSDLIRLLALLAPGASVSADAAAIAAGTPKCIEGREAVAQFFNGSAHAALPAVVDGRPGAAWFHRGKAMVAFDFTVVNDLVESIVFRAEREVLTGVIRRTSTRPEPEQVQLAKE